MHCLAADANWLLGKMRKLFPMERVQFKRDLSFFLKKKKERVPWNTVKPLKYQKLDSTWKVRSNICLRNILAWQQIFYFLDHFFCSWITIVFVRLTTAGNFDLVSVKRWASARSLVVSGMSSKTNCSRFESGR